MSFFSFYCQPICKALRYIRYEVHEPLICTGIHNIFGELILKQHLFSSLSTEQQPKLKLATHFQADDFNNTRIVGLLFCLFYFQLTTNMSHLGFKFRNFKELLHSKDQF